MSQTQSTAVSLQCQDGVSLAAQHFQSNAPQALIILGPALAVPQKFYARCAAAWADSGFDVLTFDYRGCGAAKKAVKPSAAHPLAWGSQDIDAAIRWGLDQGLPVVFLAHSMGGQLLGLAASASQLTAAVFVGSTEPHARYYPLKTSLWFNLVWRALIPAATLGREQCPLAGMKAPSVAVRQWAKWCTTPGYLFSDLSDDQMAGYHNLDFPLLNVAISDDSYAPPSAVKPMLDRYRSTRLETTTYTPQDIGVTEIEHFGYFRHAAGEKLWPETQRWISSKLQTR